MKRTILGVQLGLVLLIGLFVSIGAGSILSAMLVKLAPSGAQKLERPVEKPQEGAAQAQAQEQGVLEYNRNLFNQSSYADDATDIITGPGGEDGEGLGEEGEGAAEAFEPPPGAPVETDLRLLLVGTQVAEPARFSLAILKPVEGGSEGEAIYKRVGATIMEGDATLFHIDRNRVYFYRHSKGDQVEYLDIETTLSDVMAKGRATPKETKKEEPAKGKKSEPKGAGKAKGGSQKVASAKPAGKGAKNIDLNAIEKTGKDSFGIPRDMAEQVRNNPKALKDPKFGAPPQIQPVYQGGGVGGFRVMGVQSGSVYGMLGIQSGDIILDVNGQVVDNPQKALAFFDQLGPGQDVQVKINRRGRHRTLNYSLK